MRNISNNHLFTILGTIAFTVGGVLFHTTSALAACPCCMENKSMMDDYCIDRGGVPGFACDDDDVPGGGGYHWWCEYMQAA